MSDHIRTNEGSAQAFDRLHLKVRETLHKMGWKSLKPIQIDAIQTILDGGGDVVVSAATAGGKTEAAFLPILSTLAGSFDPGVQALYICPLKALINDQFRRVENLCELLEIPVYRWHGDVGSGAKSALLDKPSGVLLITPESIESLFVNHPRKLAHLFGDLKFIIVDEMHAFFGSERGAHLHSLMARITKIAGGRPRRVGLSATLGDMDLACQWLKARTDRQVCLIQGSGDERELKIRVHGFLTKPSKPTDEDMDTSLESEVYTRFDGKTALIFGNRKVTLELCADYARRESERLHKANNFRIHHGSLSRAEREDTEQDLKSNRPTATFCSSTLEMGIDVGEVEMVGQIDAPFSVNSLVQRVGRSGRKSGAPSILRMFLEEFSPSKESTLVNQIFPGFLRGVATVELMLAKPKQIEPPDLSQLHLSTLVQQILSLIAERSGVAAAEAYAALVESGGFPHVGKSIFVQVLRDLGAADLIEQSYEGLLILGIKGEKIVRSHQFYVSFQVPEDYRVSCAGRSIGQVAVDGWMKLEGYLILAGKRWKILQVDSERKSIEVEPSPGGRSPQFQPGVSGDIHKIVHKMMQSLLIRKDMPVYLDETAQRMLTTARSSATAAGLGRSGFVNDGSSLLWFPWAGSRTHMTLMALGKMGSRFHVAIDGPALRFEKCTEKQVVAGYRELAGNLPTPEAIASDLVGTDAEKYEPFLSLALQTKVTASRALDLKGAQEVIIGFV